MNLRKLRDAEALFLHRYPGGFANEELTQTIKKHNVGKLIEFTHDALAKKSFGQQAQVLDSLIKTVSRSSMVSMFEKPKFRDYLNGQSVDERAYIVSAYKRLLHGNQERGFNELVDALAEAKLAKWSLVTVCLFYYRPNTDVFVKPTTTKNVIRQFELENLVYKPRPSWTFYANYRDCIEQMKSKVDPSLSPNNAAFTGFLMMTNATTLH